MKIVIVIDSMKGCLSSADANQAAANGVRCVFPDADIVQIPVSDGGEGFIDAFHAANQRILCILHKSCQYRCCAGSFVKKDFSFCSFCEYS